MQTGELLFNIWMLILTPISFLAMGIVTWWFLRQHRERNQPQRVDEIWAKRTAWGEETCRKLIDYLIEAGMTAEMLKLAWGEPKQILPQAEAQGEVWLYDGLDLAQSSNYVVLQNGEVTQVVGSAPAEGFILGPELVIAILFGISFIACTVLFVILWFNWN